MNNNPDHVCISDSSPPASVARSASPETLSSAFAAEKALAELRPWLARRLDEARFDVKRLEKDSPHLCNLINAMRVRQTGLAELLNILDRTLSEVPSAANDKLRHGGE